MRNKDNDIKTTNTSKTVVSEQFEDQDTNFDQDPKDEKPKKNLRKEILSWISTIVVAFVIAWSINNFIIINCKVPSASMEPTIMTGDRLIANRLAYTFDEPERYDIIVFQYPDDPEQLFVKRVIGLPGETVTIVNGDVYIDDSTEPLDDSFTSDIPDDYNGTFVVPEDSYFVMGDNRANSHDSRYWENTYVPEEYIEGKVFLRYFPNIDIMIND